MDKIFIRDLLVRCVIGINEEERRTKQDVVISISMMTDTRKAAGTDSIEYTVDYRALKMRVLEMVQNSEFHLVEALAEHIARLCLEDHGVSEVTVSVEKPTALRFARSVGVEITRKRE
jgi:dihydroneopterin aldolase/D-erythro-7,8-dihydroneopterin triphosphate epimerase